MFAAPGFEILIIAGVWSLVAGAAAGGVINCDGGRWQPLDTQARDREVTVSCQERAQSGSGPPPPPPCSLQLQHGRNTEMIYLLYLAQYKYLLILHSRSRLCLSPDRATSSKQQVRVTGCSHAFIVNTSYFPLEYNSQFFKILNLSLGMIKERLYQPHTQAWNPRREECDR